MMWVLSKPRVRIEELKLKKIIARLLDNVVKFYIRFSLQKSNSYKIKRKIFFCSSFQNVGETVDTFYIRNITIFNFYLNLFIKIIDLNPLNISPKSAHDQQKNLKIT